jgi:kynureninase
VFKNQFVLPKDVLYLCGHSLGPTSQAAIRKVEETMQAWGREAVKAWNTAQWIDLPQRVASKIAPIIGASDREVVISDSTSVNLFKVLMSALKLNHSRSVILTTEDNFPADLYIAQGVQAFNNRTIVKTVKSAELMAHLDETISVLMLTHVNYRNASVYDMAGITKQAHRLGILVIWDLSHSVGAVPVNLNACDVDFAVGCTYKYLNGGPGSPAFMYVNARHHLYVENPIYGWMGHRQPFSFELNYRSAGIAKYVGGTPSILSLKALEGALEIFDNFDQAILYSRTQEYSTFLLRALEQLGLQVVSPRSQPRGGHVAFMHANAYAFSRALISEGVIVDYRDPDLIRLCVNPLYLDLADLQKCVQRIQMLLETKAYLLPRYQQYIARPTNR